MGKEVDITGKKFNMLTAIKRVENYKPTGTYWLCKCDCGKETIVKKYDLIHVKIYSCGCYLRKCARENHVKHDGRYTKLYNIWQSMKQRCENPNAKAYHNYGGRGITVCPEWKGEHGFESFSKWAYDTGYDENAERGEYTLDRKDNDKGYSPDNCRWATTEEQNNNRRGVYRITLNGETHSITEWSKITGIERKTIKDRLLKQKLTAEEILTPVNRRRIPGLLKYKKEDR